MMIDDDDMSKVIGRFFRMKRLEKGLSMNDVAKRCGHESKGWYSNLEYGTRNVLMKDCIKICEVLDTNLKEFDQYLIDAENKKDT
jgi:transcriptional regulator with XRE-family HTH domain